MAELDRNACATCLNRRALLEQGGAGGVPALLSACDDRLALPNDSLEHSAVEVGADTVWAGLQVASSTRVPV